MDIKFQQLDTCKLVTCNEKPLIGFEQHLINLLGTCTEKSAPKGDFKEGVTNSIRAEPASRRFVTWHLCTAVHITADTWKKAFHDGGSSASIPVGSQQWSA